MLACTAAAVSNLLGARLDLDLAGVVDGLAAAILGHHTLHIRQLDPPVVLQKISTRVCWLILVSNRHVEGLFWCCVCVCVCTSCVCNMFRGHFHRVALRVPGRRSADTNTGSSRSTYATLAMSRTAQTIARLFIPRHER